jgi:extracellular elastinolytic metalloproteinase
MSSRSSWTALVLLAAVAALAIVPGAGSAVKTSAATDKAVSTALAYAQANAGQLGVTSADVADLAVTSAYASSSGVTHVNVNQRYDGLEVFGAHATINVGARGQIVFVGGTLERGLAVASAAAKLDAAGAVAAAADGLDLAEPEDLRVLSLDLGAAQRSVVSDGGISDAPIPARLGWQPTKAGLVLAWQLVIDDSSDVHLWNATVDAASGRVLDADDWTVEDEYEELAATLTRSSAAAAATSQPAADPWPLVNVNDGSAYRVFQIAKESPNDGPRTLVENPADATASPFGWHDTNGLAGAEFTTTRGNNTHAYLDQDANNQPDFGQDVDGGVGLDFDFAVDFNEHSQAYRQAVTTSLFYGCNILHDITTLYGFDEAADSFQATNYGAVAGNGDYVRCEAADGGGTNNANFSTPSAGGTPRMQMYLWPGNQFGSQNQVSVNGVGTFGAGWARFGPPAPAAGIAGQLVDAGNGCVAADYAAAPAGDWIAITTAGNTGCQNIDKAKAAAAAGAKAIAMSAGTSTTAILTGSQTTAPPTIPAVAITTADGNTIRTAIAAGTTTGTVSKHPNHPGIRDGDFDTAIIAHEYGHGVSNRLTGGPGTNCLSGNEQAGEGWSDYLALTITMDPALDDPDEPRGLVPYVLFQPDRHGNGLRPRPYTRDMTIQPFTYDSIKTGGWLNGTSLALPHGLGHGWAAILWDMNWDLVDKHGFFPNIYDAWDKGGNNRALQYMMDGLKLQGCGPGLVVASRAIINSADLRADGVAGDLDGDTCTVWASFARRGLGYSAVQGTTNRNDNDEAFDTHPGCRRGFQAPIHQEYGQLNVAAAGRTVPLRFSGTGLTGLDILAEHSPFSRRVDCATLRVPSIGAAITPREYPVDTSPAGQSGLSRSTNGVYTYAWQTQEDWVDTCRELVLTRLDGIQHRAFFRFVEAE